MAKMEIIDALREQRRELVNAAEKNFGPPSLKWPDKTQFSRLVSVCAEASCAEEIENYLRYQATRQNAPWKSTEVVKRVIDNANSVVGKLTDDASKVEAWRLYATYLSRAFTYHDKTTREQNQQGGERRGR